MTFDEKKQFMFSPKTQDLINYIAGFTDLSEHGVTFVSDIDIANLQRLVKTFNTPEN